jgi:hypothetical protein
MTARVTVALLAFMASLYGTDPVSAQEAPATDATPARISYFYGQVSFWRPGAEGWTPAVVNTPLAPGDALFTGPDGTVEVQVGPRAFVRAAANTQVGIDNQDANYLQFRLTAGYAAVDLRGLSAGQAVEVGTPNAAFTIDRAGYYRVDVDPDSTAFAAYRSGAATLTLSNGSSDPIAPGQQAVITGTDQPQLAVGATPALTAWDNWGSQRTDYLIQTASQRYVAQGVYGAEALDRYGTWRSVATYGNVWVPSGVPVGWAPYSTGRWIWDPRFGWTWLDEAPWGWAPYHYGRWVYVSGFWAWAPGPVVVRPVYAPALVVFLGGATVAAARPVCWAPLAWGEPVIPWWGRPGFVGVPTWSGWGGPRVVNNVVIAPTTTVNVTNITVYKNVSVTNAVVGIPAGQFGHGSVAPAPVSQAQAQQLTPVPGPTTVKPVPASVAPAGGSAPAPPAAVHTRTVIVTRPPQQGMPTPQQQGLPPTSAPVPPPSSQVVPAPKSTSTPTASVPPTGTPPGSAAPKSPAPSQGKPATPPAPPTPPTASMPASPTPKPPAPSQGKPPVPAPQTSPTVTAPPVPTAPSQTKPAPPPAPVPAAPRTPAPTPPAASPVPPAPKPPTGTSTPAPTVSAPPPTPKAPPTSPMPAPPPPQAMPAAPRATQRGGPPPAQANQLPVPPPPPSERPVRGPSHPQQPPHSEQADTKK